MIFHVILFLLSVVTISDANIVEEIINATMALGTGGCNLIPPRAILGKLEPKGYPLLIHSKMHVLHIRNVPNSGGSFGVDIK